MDLAVVVNASAGPAGSDASTAEIRRAFPKTRFIDVGDEPIEHAFAEAAGATVLGVMGGDGTINAAASEALATERRLAVFPGGTLNHFARDLGIDEPAETITALQQRDITTVDVGIIDGYPFLNTASFGSYAEFVDEREKMEGKIGKWAAAAIAAAVVLRRSEPLTVSLNGERRRIWMIFIGNCEYQPADLAPRLRAQLADGLLDVRYVDGSARFSRARFVGALIMRRLAHSPTYTRVLVESLDVHSYDGPLRLARDGETFDGGVDVHVSKQPAALEVYAPPGT